MLSACAGASAATVNAPPCQYKQMKCPRVKGLPGFVPRTFPRALGYINTPTQVTPLANGDFLVADGGSFNRMGAKVVEFNPKGKVVWAYINPTLDFTHSAYPTTRGNILIADTNNNRVIEVNRAGKIVFNTDDLGPGHGYLGRGRFNDGSQLLYPNDAKQLPNGHYLISSRMNSTVYEIDRHGHVYWKCSKFTNLQGKPDGLKRQHNPQRLPNGNTLISDSDNGRVIIVNRNCTKMVWEFDEKTKTGGPEVLWPRDAMLMRNGDILIDDSLHNRVIEVNKKHEIVRKYYDIPQPYSAWPLNNGTIAVGNPNTHGITLWGPGIPQAVPLYSIPPKPVKPPFKPPSHLINGGCEPRSSSGSPEESGLQGWSQNDFATESLAPTVRADMGIDASVALSGQSSCRITWEEPTSHAPLTWTQVVKVNQYRWYTLSGYIMTKNVRFCPECNFGRGTDPANSAYFALNFIRPGPWAGPKAPDFPHVMGTTGWLHQSQTFYVPQGVKYLAVNLELVGKGTVYFDKISLRETAQRLPPGDGSGNYKYHLVKVVK